MEVEVEVDHWMDHMLSLNVVIVIISPVSTVKPGVKTPITDTDHERINIFHTATLVRTMMEVVEEEVEVEEVTLVSLSLQYSRHC